MNANEYIFLQFYSYTKKLLQEICFDRLVIDIYKREYINKNYIKGR